MKILSFILVFLIAVTIPLAAQDFAAGDDDGFIDDDFPLIGSGSLTIVGSRNTTQQMEVIDRETIEKTNAQDIPSLLEETVGLGVTRYGPYGSQADVNIRGFDTERVAVLIDGIPVNSSSSGGFDFYSIDPLSIERIEIIYGGSDTKYNVSGALGGVINIITVKQNKPGWSFGGSIANTAYLPGQYNKWGGGLENPQWQDLLDAQNINLFGAYGAENHSFNVGLFGNRVGNHFLHNDFFNIVRRKEGNEVLDAGASASFIRNIGTYSKFIASGMFYLGDKNIPVSGYTSEFKKQKDISSRGNIMLDMPRAFHDDVSMEIALSHNWNNYEYGVDTSNPTDHNEHTLTFINRWAWQADAKFTLRFGGDYRFIYLDSSTTGLHYGNRGGLYITPEYSPLKNLFLIASVKGMTDGREIIPVPKLGWAWTLSDSVTLKNNYFRSFKFPDFDDLYWVQGGYMGNPDLKSEDGWGADLGVELSAKDLLKFNSTVYGEWTINSIHWDNSSGFWRPENYGEAVFLGWDNKVKLTLPFASGFLEKPTLNLSWLFQMSWLLSGDLTFKDDRRIPYMPVHTLGLSLELPWKTVRNKLSGSLVISGRYESTRYANTTNITKLDPHLLLNITYNQKLNKHIGVFGKIHNLLNTSYVSFADYPMPGISMTLGVNLGK